MGTCPKINVGVDSIVKESEDKPLYSKSLYFGGAGDTAINGLLPLANDAEVFSYLFLGSYLGVEHLI